MGQQQALLAAGDEVAAGGKPAWNIKDQFALDRGRPRGQTPRRRLVVQIKIGAALQKVLFADGLGLANIPKPILAAVIQMPLADNRQLAGIVGTQCFISVTDWIHRGV